METKPSSPHPSSSCEKIQSLPLLHASHDLHRCEKGSDSASLQKTRDASRTCEPVWWAHFRAALCSSVIREELRGDFSSAFKVVDNVLQLPISGSSARIDAHFAKGLLLLLSGNPQAATHELRSVVFLATEQKDYARQLRGQLWLDQALYESRETCLDGSYLTEDTSLHAKFGLSDDYADLLRSREAEIKRLKAFTTDCVALEECTIVATYFRYIALARQYAFSLCPANVVVPEPEHSFVVKAINRIEITRSLPPVARGSGFASRQRARIFSLCGQKESLINKVTNYKSVHDDHERGLALLLESDLVLCRAGATVEHWGSIAGLGGWFRPSEETHEDEFYQPSLDELQRASALITSAEQLFEAVGSPRGLANAYLRKSYCSVLGTRWDEGKRLALRAYEVFQTAQDHYGENVARLHVVLANIGGNVLVDMSGIVSCIGEWGIDSGSFSVAVSFACLLLRVASVYWIKRKGGISEALACCRAAGLLYERLACPIGAAEAAICEARVFHLCGATDDEIIRLQNALMIFKNMGKVSRREMTARRDSVADLAIALIDANTSQELNYEGLERVMDLIGVYMGFKSGRNSLQSVQKLLKKFQDFFGDIAKVSSSTAAKSKMSFLAVHALLKNTQILVPAMKASSLQFQPDLKTEFHLLQTLAVENAERFCRNPREKAFYLAIVHHILKNPEEERAAALQHYSTLSEYPTESVIEDMKYSLCEHASINPDGSSHSIRKELRDLSSYQSMELEVSFSLLVHAKVWPQARECLDSINELNGTADWWRSRQHNLLLGGRIAALLAREGKLEEALIMFDECIACVERSMRTMPNVEARASYAVHSGSIDLLFRAARAVFDYLSTAEKRNKKEQGMAERLFAYLEATKGRSMLDLKTSYVLLAGASSRDRNMDRSSQDPQSETTVIESIPDHLDATALPDLKLQSADVFEWQRLTQQRSILVRITARLLIEGRVKGGSFSQRRNFKFSQKRLKETREALDACDGKINEITERLCQAHPALARLAQARGKNLSLSAVQDFLPSNALLVQYFTSKDAIFILIVTKCGMTERQIVEIPERKLHILIERFQSACQSEPATNLPRSVQQQRYLEEAKGLKSVLLDPINRCLRQQVEKSHEDDPVRMIIVPHRRLNKVPFHALPWIDDKPLAFFFTVSYLFSASELQFVRAGTLCNPLTLNGSRSVLVGNPERMSHMHPVTGKRKTMSNLTGAIEEVHSLESLLGKHEEECFVITGKDATWARIHKLLTKENEQSAPISTILHLATHFIYVPEAPLWSAVLLANGENLTALRLSSQMPALDLLVLSACESAQGDSTHSGDYRGMVEALRAAGVRRVVATLWPVRDTIAHDTMTMFYGGILDGLEPAQALRKAQLSVRDRYGSPCFWAPFVIIG